MDERIIRTKLEHIRRKIVRNRWPITEWEARTAQYLAPGKYLFDDEWQPVTTGTSWPALKTVFLRTFICTPHDVPASVLAIEFDVVGLEGLLTVNGRPWAGIDANHSRVPIPTEGELQLEAEFICWLRALEEPEWLGEQARLRDVALVQIDPTIAAFYYDLWFTWQASRVSSDERRRQLLHMALEEALLAVDLTLPFEKFTAEVQGAQMRLGSQLMHIAPDPEAGHIFLTGHTHIDVAWLWTIGETVRKTGRTFATACRLLERYPEFHFSCSQPQLYAYVREHFPALYAEIKHWVQEGRWECTGGMWVESDCNIPSGESLIRQILYGLTFFRQEFGARPRVCWLPDVFGYPASLPGILKGCGLDSFFTCKLHWQARNPFPAHLFWWEGIDGTRILAHVPKLAAYYTGSPTPQELQTAWDNYLQKAAYAEVLFPFGYGDGGGGPTAEMAEFALRARAFPGLPVCRQGPAEQYFADVLASAPNLPVWVGELYLETHRGTYTTQGAIKKANRRNELLLREAELFGVLAQAQGVMVDLKPLASAWENLLLLQFHDILPGSSIGEVYREATADHARIERTAREVRDNALKGLASTSASVADLIAFNSLSWRRSDIVRATVPIRPEWFPDGAQGGTTLEVVDSEGSVTPAQVVEVRDGKAEIIFAPSEVPAIGYATFSLRPARGRPEHSLRVSENGMENRFFLLQLNENGELVRLFDKRYEREVIPTGSPANRLQLFQDGPEGEAAWNIHATFEQREYAWDPGTYRVVIERGPVRAMVRVHRHYRETYLEQDIVLYDRVPRIDFVTRVNWQARQTLLKAAFPVKVRAMYATYEIQFGAIERPTHRNTSWDQEKFEVCAHRWADLSEAGYGVSLLNDCKYGYDVHGNVLRLTLLRGTETPDPNADRGHHEFTYALLPHLGDWRSGETVQRAWELNVPIICLPSEASSETTLCRRSFLMVDGPAILQTLKPAEDGDGWIMRLYEPHGGRGNVRIWLDYPLREVLACNHVEENLNQPPLPVRDRAFKFEIHPFEVRTFRLRI